ncbi:MAG: tetratricopeptide repeat protein [Acidobacteriota bacterium]
MALTTWEPCLLLLDDLQWADELTLGFLFHLLRAGTLSESKLLVVATFRSDEMGPALRELLAAESVTHVHLGRLPERAIADMVCDMLAVDAAPPFVPSIVRLSEGNPFYVAEYLRTTIALGFLRRDVAGRWQSSADSRFDPAYASLPLPGSVKELVSEHLLGLDPRTRRVLDMAAVLGREIPGELLEAAWGGDGSEVLEAVQELLSRQVIEEQGSLLRFAHDRTREVAYQALGAQERRALHRKAAEVIARSFPAQATTEPGTLAHHWEEAGEPLLARPHYLAGARLALTRHDLVEAEKLYVRHLALFAEPTAGAVSARNELGERVLQMSGRERQALDEHRRALDEARSLGDASLEARSRSGLARASAATGNPQEAIELYEEALRLSGGGVDPAEEARAALGLADVRRDRGDREIADGLYRTVLERHEAANDHAGIGRLLGKLAGLDLMAGRVTDAEALFRRALELHRTCGESREEAITLSNLAGVLLGRGRLDEAIELNRRALAIYGIVGDRRLEGLTVMNLAVVHYNRGEYEEAGRLHAQALEVARETGDLRWEGIALSYVAGVHEVTARPNDAIECYERALQILERVGDRRFQSLASINLAGVLLGLGRNDEARRRTEEGLALMDALGDERSKPFALRQLAVVELHAGLADRALDLLDAACERFREIAELLPLSDTLIYQAKVARIARGDIARARLLVARARAALDELGDPTHASQRASCDAEEAFVDLAGGGTADAALARLRAAGDSGRARDLAALIEECLAARKAGQPLVHGQLPHQLEPSLRRFLAGS